MTRRGFDEAFYFILLLSVRFQVQVQVQVMGHHRNILTSVSSPRIGAFYLDMDKEEGGLVLVQQ